MYNQARNKIEKNGRQVIACKVYRTKYCSVMDVQKTGEK